MLIYPNSDSTTFFYGTQNRIGVYAVLKSPCSCKENQLTVQSCFIILQHIDFDLLFAAVFLFFFNDRQMAVYTVSNMFC